jgi:hypothetical protein
MLMGTQLAFRVAGLFPSPCGYSTTGADAQSRERRGAPRKAQSRNRVALGASQITFHIGTRSKPRLEPRCTVNVQRATKAMQIAFGADRLSQRDRHRRTPN